MEDYRVQGSTLGKSLEFSWKVYVPVAIESAYTLLRSLGLPS